MSTRQLIRNWLWVYLGNMTGAMSLALLMFFAKQYQAGGGAVGQNMLNIAKTKCELDFVQAVALGILCNVLVCLAVWLSYSVRSSAGKILCIVFPVAAFVAAGFEHSIANMYFIPVAMLVKDLDPGFLSTIHHTAQDYSSISWPGLLLNNLLPVTIGNIVGGAGW